VHREIVMKKWLRRILGAVGMSLTWAAGWGLVGVLIGMFVDPHGSIDDMWVVTLGVPGFLGGVVFSAVLGIAEGRRRFDELPLSRFGFWGAVAGLLLGVLPFAVGSPNSELPPWVLGVVIIGSMTLMSAVSAVGSALLFRYFAREQTPAGAGPEG
jgi:hypothetical protein